MLPKIREHVNERVSYRARRRERSSVPPIRPKTPAAKYQRIHRACDANSETPNPRGQRACVARFDNQVEVIGLRGEMDDSKASRPPLRRGRDGETNRRKHVLTA